GENGEDDLVVEDQLLAAADDVEPEQLAALVRRQQEAVVFAPLLLRIDLVGRTERPHLEAADRVDATGEVALEEWQLGLSAVPDAVAEVPSGGEDERRAELPDVEERDVPARARHGVDEPAVAEDPGDLDRDVLEGAGGRVEQVVPRIAEDARNDRAGQA